MPARPGYDKEIHTAMQAIKGITAPQVARMAAKKGRKISPTTIYKLRKLPEEGGTKYPQNYTLTTLGLSVGLVRVWATVETAKTIPKPNFAQVAAANQKTAQYTQRATTSSQQSVGGRG